MQKTRSAAAFALCLFLASATSSFAAVDRYHAEDPSVAPTPIQRLVQLIKRIVKPLDTLGVPRP